MVLGRVCEERKQQWVWFLTYFDAYEVFFCFFVWQQNPRLVLCEATAVVMKKGMFLLGITPLEKI